MKPKSEERTSGNATQSHDERSARKFINVPVFPERLITKTDANACAYRKNDQIMEIEDNASDVRPVDDAVIQILIFDPRHNAETMGHE